MIAKCVKREATIDRRLYENRDAEVISINGVAHSSLSYIASPRGYENALYKILRSYEDYVRTNWDFPKL